MYYPANSPNLGIQLMKVGKIQLYLGKLQDSFKTFTQVRVSLQITMYCGHKYVIVPLSLFNLCLNADKYKWSCFAVIYTYGILKLGLLMTDYLQKGQTMAHTMSHFLGSDRKISYCSAAENSV